MRKEIRWGIIGCGDVTEVKSGPGFQKAGGSRLVAVMRRNAELARDYAQRHGVPKWYDDAGALIDDPQVDAVYIAAPPALHKPYTLAVARAGKPVYVEKPMALNFEECREMITACEKAGVPLFVAYYRRALPRFLRIKSLLADGAIGEIRFVSVCFYKEAAPRDLAGENHWRVDPQIAGCGYFCDLASHMFDILQYFLGEITAAKGYVANQLRLYEAEDMVSGVFSFASGVQGAGVWNFNAFADQDRTEIVGEKGKIAFSTFGEEPLELQTGAVTRKFDIKNPPHIQQPLIQMIVDQLLGKGESPSTGHTAAGTSWVMDQILKGDSTF